MELATRLFPLWAVLLSVVAWLAPGAFTPLAPAIPWLLGVVMLGMGLTLTASSFTLVARRPLVVAAGVGMQYLIMPLAAWLIARVLGLPPQLAAGAVLVGSSPGGTASNVITWLARGDVALSITLTAVSTALSAVATPLLTWLLVGQRVPVPAGDMLVNIATIVLLPVAAGVAVNTRFGRHLARVRSFFPLISVAAIVLIIAVIAALNRDQLAGVGGAVVATVALHNLTGLGAAWLLAGAFGFSEAEKRTLAIEVGMQNSGLAVVLAHRHFSALAALPGAVFSIWHNLTGSLLAGWWSQRPIPERTDA